jgi:hypothetical protein
MSDAVEYNQLNSPPSNNIGGATVACTSGSARCQSIPHPLHLNGLSVYGCLWGDCGHCGLTTEHYGWESNRLADYLVLDYLARMPDEKVLY